MTITQIMIFVRVAETLNFTQTAQDLHMTQPAVSHAIASIENELDAKLLLRDRKRGVLLTDLGRKLLPEFRGMLQYMERIDQQVASEKGLEVGTLTIGAFPSASAHFLPPIIKHIRQQYPNLVFDLHEGSTNEVKEWVHTRKIEAGIILLPDQEVDVVPLYKDHMIIILPEGHPLHHEKYIDIQMLDGQDMILCKGGHEVAILEAFERENTRLNIKFTTHSISTLVNMVRQDLGIGIVSELAISMFPHELTVREVAPKITREIGIAVPSLPQASLAVKMFVRTAEELFADKL
ncbi:LysR family transcriptional regulator [Neobacillus mesonae]|nr:LysR family transcriptional regulator [Neobacillus mesonae]